MLHNRATAARIAALALATCLTAATAQDSAPATPPAPAPAADAKDLLRDAVDPYNPMTERGRFFTAAGVDNELDDKEFAADRQRKDPFVRAFDRWDAAKAFDKNANGSLDWFEADAYRQDLRTQVMKAFDADNNRKLTGEERKAAEEALKSGRVLTPRRTTPRPRPGQEMPEDLKRFDRDGDGKLSEEERAGIAEQLQRDERRQRLEKWDADGDGELSAEERKAMRDYERQRTRPWQEMFDQFNLQHFDTDGDGKLSDEEKTELRAYQKELEGIGKEFELRQNDLDGDGKVSSEERQEVRKEWQRSVWRLVAKAMVYMDADGDGKISEEEKFGFVDRAREAMGGWIETTTRKYDADGNGRLGPEERKESIKGLREEFNKRFADNDRDHSGRLDPVETIRLIEQFGAEIGIKPVRPAASSTPSDPNQ